MTFKQIIKQVATGAVTLGAGFGTMGILTELIDSGMDDFTPMFMLLIVTSGLSFFSGKYFLKQRKDVKRLEVESLEKEVLRLTVLNDGRLNVTEAVLELNISVDKAKNALDHLVEQGVLQTGISDEGGISYELVDFLGQDKIEKSNSSFLD